MEGTKGPFGAMASVQIIHSSSTLRRLQIDDMVPESDFVVDSVVNPHTNEPRGVVPDSFKVQLESVMGVIKQAHPAGYSNCNHKGIVVVEG
jgi:hypothetical protein